jgi:hypothetical protein
MGDALRVSGTVLGSLGGNSWYEIDLNANAIEPMAGKRLSVAPR